jgi:hypothetical protein
MDGRRNETVEESVAFEVVRVDDRPQRTFVPIALVGGLFVILAGAAALGRPTNPSVTPEVVVPSTAPAAQQAAPAVDATSRPRADRLVLTLPSYEGAAVHGDRIVVVGYVVGDVRTVAVVLGAAEKRLDLGTFTATSKAGDPAADRRSWFRTEIDVAARPFGPRLWLEVSLVAPDGSSLAVVRRGLVRVIAHDLEPVDELPWPGLTRLPGDDGGLGGLWLPDDD